MHQSSRSTILISQLGTCQIKISASGKFALEHDLQMLISPDELHTLALYTIQECVGKEHSGGYTTKNLTRPAQYLTSLDNGFPWSLYLPASTTFISAMVWHSEHANRQENGFDPGNHDAQTSRILGYEIYDKYEEAPEDSEEKAIMAYRWNYIEAAAVKQDEYDFAARALKLPWWNNYMESGIYIAAAPPSELTASS